MHQSSIYTSNSSTNNCKRIGIFGSTGSIGKQALEVISQHADKFSATILTAHTNHILLIEQALKYKPALVVIVDQSKYQLVQDALAPLGILVLSGEESLEEAASLDIYDMMLAAIVGFASLKPTLKAL